MADWQVILGATLLGGMPSVGGGFVGRLLADKLDARAVRAALAAEIRAVLQSRAILGRSQRRDPMA